MPITFSSNNEEICKKELCSVYHHANRTINLTFRILRVTPQVCRWHRELVTHMMFTEGFGDILKVTQHIRDVLEEAVLCFISHTPHSAKRATPTCQKKLKPYEEYKHKWEDQTTSTVETKL